jgi:plasmid stabilization system protein ParE
MSFHVRTTDTALDDVRGILRWIAERSPSGAEAWYRRWREVLTDLQKRADVYGLAPENEDHPELIRHILFKTRRGRTYRALFVVRDLILHVRGPGQRLLRPDELE